MNNTLKKNNVLNEKSFIKNKLWLKPLIAILLVIFVIFLLIKLNWQIFDETFVWIKTIHVLAIICWMAGMLYLPRLFVYHCQAEIGSKQSETFKIMERRLLKAIINPAMIISWITGLYMAYAIYQFQGGWLHLKLFAVLLLSIFHSVLARGTRHFASDCNNFSEKTWRILNEIPTLLMIIAVIAVIVKPF